MRMYSNLKDTIVPAQAGIQKGALQTGPCVGEDDIEGIETLSRFTRL